MSAALTDRTVSERVHRQVVHLMGMPVSLALRGRHADTADGQRAWAAVIGQLQQVDRTFSTYRDDSVINRMDRGELSIDQCPRDVLEVLELARQAEQQSGGAFSIHLPGPGGRHRLDPSGVVKGWAVQRASLILADLDNTDFCLSAGGDMVCRTTGTDRPDWRIGIEHPHRPGELIAVVPIRNGAVATSGTAHRGQHLVDARTGRVLLRFGHGNYVPVSGNGKRLLLHGYSRLYAVEPRRPTPKRQHHVKKHAPGRPKAR